MTFHRNPQVHPQVASLPPWNPPRVATGHLVVSLDDATLLEVRKILLTITCIYQSFGEAAGPHLNPTHFWS